MTFGTFRERKERTRPGLLRQGGGPCGELDDGLEGLTLVDARNGFNELPRYAKLWTARHHWPKGMWFAFNCYRH